MNRRLVAVLTGCALSVPLLSGCLEEGNTTDVRMIETTPSGTPLPTTPTPSPDPTGSSPSPQAPTSDPRLLDTVATGLEVPWGLDFMPDGDAVVTERDSGRVLLLRGEEHRVVEAGTVDEAAPEGEAGLLGVAVSPDFEEDRLLYLYVSTAEDNRVVRARLRGTRLGETEPVLTGIPNGFIHDGGRLEFGPDGFLYVSTGDAGEPSRAPDPDSLGGKILRITAGGDPAPGNPEPDSPVFSSGHRNVQGLAFVADRLWASEFGSDEADELNLVEGGEDHGWPEVEGTGGTEQGYTDPQLTWETGEASPSGLAFAAGHLWLAALQGERLWRVEVDRDGATASEPTAYFVGEHGRMRTVAEAPDGSLWVTTSNRDGRGSPDADDDRILRIRP
ncbi:Soluble aldose sugar dehydrogenase YliI precursor [Nocardioides dokdonensis FR1436]|uniref:Soluble aldose sugar dehydrogenase YliI n=1 Tax=Nocardioides dokdonensis FR1436 TaxID=1300347 RepID=A0A1A9GMY7_9ACTN|nr:PQQ-dependent sugar dehydrogenase [Nocardioides dokdonensis]ANH38851.1 Soluble aldose sugar dehydrogenase YliI precursor [Nocardioides dokdonensis FR1436]